jgi:hypothetical protein
MNHAKVGRTIVLRDQPGAGSPKKARRKENLDMRIILAAVFLVGMVEPAMCGAVTDFLKLHDEPIAQSIAETKILGLQAGFMEANAYLTGVRKEAPMYCQPANLSLTADQLIDMLRRGVDDQPELDQSNLASALLAVMRRTFPCQQNSK